jgi:hypothetical protein
MSCTFTAAVHIQGPVFQFVTHGGNMLVLGPTRRLDDHPLISLHNSLFSVFSLHVFHALFFKASCCLNS